MIDTSDRDRCDHCGMPLPLSGGYAVVHRDCLASLKARIEMLEAENGLLRAEIAAHPFSMTRTGPASTASVAVSWPAPAVALPCRLCEEAAARVEVMTGDERAALCWYCSGVGDRYWLPADYPCIHCGEPAGVQVTAADGLTRIARLELEHAELRRVLRELWDEYVTEPWPGDDTALDSILSRFADYLLEEG